MILPHRFLHDETGAISVDWIVLCACIVGLAAMAGSVALGGVEGLSTTVATDLQDTDV
ncbi:MAG: hypothetical protein AAFZ04_09145 [Pseudomonadota bacterium]